MPVTVSIADEVTDELIEAFVRLTPQLSSSSPPPDRDQLTEIVTSPATHLLIARGADGKVTQVEVETSSGFKRLDRAALAGLKRWRFRPALENGVPVASRLRHKVSFVYQ